MKKIKMLKNSTLVLIIILFIIFKFYDVDRLTTIYTKQLRKTTSIYTKFLKDQYDLQCYGFGGSFMSNIKQISLDFESPKNMTIENARSLIVNCTVDLLNRINSDKNIRPYLSHYPFTDAGIELDIGQIYHNNNNSEDAPIDSISLRNGLVYYYIYNFDDKSRKCIHKESYEEALRKVRYNRKLCLKKEK